MKHTTCTVHCMISIMVKKKVFNRTLTLGGFLQWSFIKTSTVIFLGRSTTLLPASLHVSSHCSPITHHTQDISVSLLLFPAIIKSHKHNIAVLDNALISILNLTNLTKTCSGYDCRSTVCIYTDQCHAPCCNLCWYPGLNSEGTSSGLLAGDTTGKNQSSCRPFYSGSQWWRLSVWVDKHTPIKHRP